MRPQKFFCEYPEPAGAKVACSPVGLLLHRHVVSLFLSLGLFGLTALLIAVDRVAVSKSVPVKKSQYRGSVAPYRAADCWK